MTYSLRTNVSIYAQLQTFHYSMPSKPSRMQPRENFTALFPLKHDSKFISFHYFEQGGGHLGFTCSCKVGIISQNNLHTFNNLCCKFHSELSAISSSWIKLVTVPTTTTASYKTQYKQNMIFKSRCTNTFWKYPRRMVLSLICRK